MAVLLTFCDPVVGIVPSSLAGEVPEILFGILYPNPSEQKKRRTGVRLSGANTGDDQAGLTLRAVASALASWPRMKARRIGLITKIAISAAVALSATAITNTACQP